MLDTPRAKIALFLVLTILLSSIWWVRIIASGSLRGYATYLMWSPGVAALITRVVTQRNLKGQGWAPWRPWALLAGYGVPFAYALPVYALAWAVGLGALDPAAWSRIADHFGIVTGPIGALLVLATVGVFFSLLNGLGEEIGWRGLLVPELAKVSSFRVTATVSGAIWGLWHTPILIGADYNGGETSVWWSLLCFGVMVIAGGWITAWLRLRSGSLWPAAIFHAAHNLWVQAVFDAGTHDNGHATWWIGEFGAGLAITSWLAVWYLVRRWPVTTEGAAAT